MSGRKLPAGWVEVPLAEIANSQLGKMLDKAKRTAGTSLPYLRNVNVRWGEIDLSDLLEMPFTADEFDHFGLCDGDVLICEGGEPGRAAIWRGGNTPIKFQKALHRVRLLGGCDPRWLTFHLRKDAAAGGLSNYFTGTTIKHFTGEALRRYPVALPPLPEQRRTVEKIEALTARSRRARQALDTLPALIDRYRQSILAAAFRGDLSNDGNYGRRAMTVEELVAEPTCNGISIRGTDEPPGIPALRLNALTDQGIDFDARRYIPLEEDRAKRIYVRENDFFVSRGNGSLDLVGRGALASNPPEPIVFPDTMIRIRLDQTAVLPEWFAFIWGAPQIRDQIRARVKTTAGIWKISQRDLSSITVDVPDVHVQVEELRKIRQALGAIEKCRVRFDTATARLATLDQSILAKAFRGELVPQDPNDEPASVLLERIRAERAAAGPAPRRGRRPKAAGGG